MDIGKNIREAREEQGLIVSEVARRAGLTISGVTSIETGRVRNPTIDTVVHIARALGVEPAELLKEAPDPKVIALPRTPLTDTDLAELDKWRKSARSAAEADKGLRDITAEVRDLEQFRTGIVSRKIDRAHLIKAALLDTYVKLADDRRDPTSNVFKSIEQIASELGGRYLTPGERKSLDDLLPPGPEEQAG
jgi:transcriptional regulator with XRE-family HTH domain